MKIVVGNIEIKKTMEKHCKGYYDLLKREIVPCQSFTDLTESEYCQCKACQTKSTLQICHQLILYSSFFRVKVLHLLGLHIGFGGGGGGQQFGSNFGSISSISITSTPILHMQLKGTKTDFAFLKSDQELQAGFGTTNPKILHVLTSKTRSMILPRHLPSTTLITCLHLSSA